MPGPTNPANPNDDRFSGFADLYDANRPSPPAHLGPLLAWYAAVAHPQVVDLGSGTGLSTRWAATWAASVIGIEPNADMRTQAQSRQTANVEHRAGRSDATGLADDSADIVLAVQAMHWMEPDATLREVARVLRPGGVFAVIDADWPPVSGCVGAEVAWDVLHRRIRVLEARIATGETPSEAARPIVDDDPALADDDGPDPHRNRRMPGGITSWSKREHLARMRASGHFAYTRELLADSELAGGAERFVALAHSQGSYQGLRKLGLDDELIGMRTYEDAVRASFGPEADRSLRFNWRCRLGVTPA